MPNSYSYTAKDINEWFDNHRASFGQSAFMDFLRDAALRGCSSEPSSEVLESAVENCLGWAAGIEEHTKDEASRKVAGWIIERCKAALSSCSATQEKGTK